LSNEGDFTVKLAHLIDGRRRRTVAAGAAAVGAVIVLTIVFVLSSVTPPVGLGSSPSPDPSGSSSPSPPPGDWATLTLAPYEPIAELIPETVVASGVDPAGSFTLRSLAGIPALELAAGLRSEPALELVVEAGPTADTATVTPASPLFQGARYRFQLRRDDGSLAAEWSFRTSGPLHVVRVLPSDRATQVPVDTGIEVEFDQDGATGLEGHLKIDPAATGRLERHGRTWVFVPDTDLAAETLYTVVVTRGVGMTGSEQVLESDVRFQFETAGPSTELNEAVIVFPRAMQEAQSGDTPVLHVDVQGP
jgi:hypothetical protein